MKVMNLFLVLVVLLLGFVVAEVNDISLGENQTGQVNSSFENGTIVVSSGDDLASPNGSDDVLVNESAGDEEVVEDLALDGYDSGEPEVVVKRDSPLDSVVSYVSSVIDKVNEVHENLFYIILIVVWVLLMILHSIFYGEKSAGTCFARASSFHRKAQRAHVNGDYVKAKKLYSKSYSLREEGERKVESEL